MYQQTRLSDHTAIGNPGPLPTLIDTWDGADDLLADLTSHVDPQFSFEGTGFWQFDLATPTFDATTHVLTGEIVDMAVDPVARRWTGTATVRAMTPQEFLAANPVPEYVTNYQARSILVQDGLFAAVDAGVRASGNLLAIQAWDYANNFYRASPFIALLAGNFSLSDQQVDDIFRRASKVQ